MLLTFVAAASWSCLATPGVILEIDPGKPLVTTGFGDPPTPMNNNFNIGRGVVFLANSDFVLQSAGLWVNPTAFTLTFDLYEIVATTSTDLTAGAKLLTAGATSHSNPQGNLDFFDVSLPDIPLQSGTLYYLNASFPENVTADQLFQFDAERRGDAPVNLGLLTLIDGVGNHDTANSDSPLLRIMVADASVTEPCTLVLFALGIAGVGVAATRVNSAN